MGWTGARVSPTVLHGPSLAHRYIQIGIPHFLFWYGLATVSLLTRSAIDIQVGVKSRQRTSGVVACSWLVIGGAERKMLHEKNLTQYLGKNIKWRIFLLR
ncbi:hypothetical protein SKAU_G00310210 [Synaphobranchus kaupii]|uniref:Uncharacterized protein n=1 Tax=Synaphobranchus kaupii TaxID=118154 RepID=A0A9Q1IL63_SYNKA|nr:hypothetical protein SKAU_G00310210 [Synaphobranchus kaupii]